MWVHPHMFSLWNKSLHPTDTPRPSFSVSPYWLTPGASVTLTCEVEHPSAGWKFYWNKFVPRLSDKYMYEALLISSNGTEQDTYIIHGQTHTAQYMCRAERGNHYFDSLRSFVFSGGQYVCFLLYFSHKTYLFKIKFTSHNHLWNWLSIGFALGQSFFKSMTLSEWCWSTILDNASFLCGIL